MQAGRDSLLALTFGRGEGDRTLIIDPEGDEGRMGRGNRSSWLRGLMALAALGLAVASGVSPCWAGGLGALGAAVPAFADAGALQPIKAEPYEWWSSRDEKRIKIRGLVPSEEDRKTIHGMIKANMPDLEIDDRMKVADGAPPKQTWLGAVSFALVQLSQLKSGVARLAGTDFYIEGEARTASSFAAINTAVATQVPHGIALKEATVTPPVAKPFVWTAQYEDGALTLAGNVPSDDLRARLLEDASRLFGKTKIIDHMELAAGVPDNWAEAVKASLHQLSRLESGKVSLADTALTIEGVAETKGIAADVAAAIKQGLPKSYDAKDSIRYRLSGSSDQPRSGPRPGLQKASAKPGLISPALDLSSL